MKGKRNKPESLTGDGAVTKSMCVHSMSNADGSKDFQRQHQSRFFQSSQKTRPGATQSTPHYTHGTHLCGDRYSTTAQGSENEANWSFPHQGYSKALASIFHKTPHGERCYQLPQDSSGHAVRTWLCCNSRLSSRPPHTLCHLSHEEPSFP